MPSFEINYETLTVRGAYISQENLLILLLGGDLSQEFLLGVGDLLLPGLAGQFLGGPALLVHLLLGSRFAVWIGTDGIVSLLVHALQVVGLQTGLDELRELLLVSVFVLLLQVTHVIGDVTTEDMFTMDFGVKFVGFVVVARETLGGVGDVDATVSSTLHGAKDAGTGRGSGQTDVQAGVESASLSLILDHELVTVDLSLTLVDVAQVELVQNLKFSSVLKSYYIL